MKMKIDGCPFIGGLLQPKSTFDQSKSLKLISRNLEMAKQLAGLSPWPKAK